MHVQVPVHGIVDGLVQTGMSWCAYSAGILITVTVFNDEYSQCCLWCPSLCH